MSMHETGDKSSGMDWAAEVEALYVRDEDMEVDEFEALLAVAMTGERPDDPRLPSQLAPRPPRSYDLAVAQNAVDRIRREAEVSRQQFYVAAAMLLGTITATGLMALGVA